ncbi:Peptidoglycan/LPS O-acetylase OafA/YrhL, contains acyltransferase and SGNH-hydrolase domains [Tenacibaculum sp. 190524A02b]|uniref:Peptidoglycan/LPS O-acetylase OafA/YrhL, contains acyltransferase and SGNH-hydrolase domains n=1 Tax=Tenacibaculum vairaonense TaxID=3137860 RepID=A0ABP1F8R4_9FLAO
MSTTITKTKRIQAIDLARGIGVFFIPMAHTLLIYGTTYTQEESWLGLLVHFFGKWAGVFLIAMGFSYTLSKRNTISSSIKRGLYLLGIGYFMNFLKFIVPTVLGVIPDSFIKAYGWTPPANFGNMIYMLLTGDILQLAGVCLFFMGVVHKYGQKNKYITLVLAVLVLLITEFIRGYRIGIPGVDYILDLLWGKDWNVYFSVFPWGAFIFVGMFFGYLFNESNKDVEKTFKAMLYAGLATVIIGGALCFYDYEYHMRDYFHLGAGGVLYLLGYNLLFFWLAQIILKRIKPNKITDVFFYCSNRITSIYVVQWALICWGMTFFGYHDKTVVPILLLMILFTVLTFAVQKVVDKAFEKSSKK